MHELPKCSSGGVCGRRRVTDTLEWLTSTEITWRFRISRNRLIELRLAGEHNITQGCRTVWDIGATERALRAYPRLRVETQVGTVSEEVA